MARRFWFSAEQKRHYIHCAEQDLYWSKFSYSPFSFADHREVFVEIVRDGEPVRVEYTECCDTQTHPNYEPGWPDAVLLGEFDNAKIVFGALLVSEDRRRFILGTATEAQ